MVIEHAHEPETVFGVFAAHARRRSHRSLVEQAVACTVGALLILLVFAPWWPAAAALGAVACYAAWGLLDRHVGSRLSGPTLRALAALATLLAIVAVVGVGLAAFTGDARSPYGTCYDANGRAFACDARGQRRL